MTSNPAKNTTKESTYMKRSSKELKRIAREQLNNRYRVPMGAFVTASIIAAAIEIPFSMSLGDNPSITQLIITFLAEYLILLLSQILSAGVIRVHLNMARGYEFRIQQIFAPFRERFERYFGAAFFLSLLSIAVCIPMIAGILVFAFCADNFAFPALILGFVVSVILVVYVALTYNFVFFFLLDYPQMKAIDAFHESRRLMQHNRLRLFRLLLSFIGYGVLVLCSLGIASLWVSPYMTQTLVTFYLDATGELDQIPVRSYYTNATPYSRPEF
jgi:uncharacterized membrane protein